MKFRTVLLGLLLLLGLGGCSAKFMYNNLHLVLPWYIDDYISFTKAQKAIYKPALKSLHEWHRYEELPKYHATLDGLLAQMQGVELDPQALDASLEEFRMRWAELVEQLTPTLTTLAHTLSEDQIAKLFDEMEKQSAERLSENEKETPEKRLKRVRADLKGWIGKLSDSQEKLLQGYLEQVPNREPETVAAHREFQQTLRSLLAERDSPDFDVRFAVAMNNPLAGPEGQKLSALRDQSRMAAVGFYTALWSDLGDRQRERVRDKIKDYLSDIEDLTAQ